MKSASPRLSAFFVSFCADLTRRGQQGIPLGALLEATWDGARWLGVIGRVQLEQSEREQINLHTWSELDEPFKLITDVFQFAWKAEAGGSYASVAERWRSSALITEGLVVPPLRAFDIADDDQWENAKEGLRGSLRNAFLDHLTSLRPLPHVPRPPGKARKSTLAAELEAA